MHESTLLDYEFQEAGRKTKRARTKGRQRSGIEQEHLQLRMVTPRSAAQKRAFDSYRSGNNILMHGVAGTGKTFLAIYLALREILDGTSRVKKLVIIRSAVQGRELGFTPGGPREKMAPYETPYMGIFSELFGRDDAYGMLKIKGTVQFLSTSFIRGTTIEDAIVIADEVQNMDAGELNTIITRLGKNSRLVMCGDHRQDDLTGKKGQVSGLREIFNILDSMGGMATIEFGIQDVQRSGFVREYLAQRIKLGIDVPLLAL